MGRASIQEGYGTIQGLRGNQTGASGRGILFIQIHVSIHHACDSREESPGTSTSDKKGCMMQRNKD